MERNRIMMPGIVSAGYDVLSEVLELEFLQDGQIWQYYDVPEAVWYAFRECTGVQKFFNTKIAGIYHAKRIH